MIDGNLPDGWEMVQLDNLCVKKTGKRKPADAPDQVFTYIDISSVDRITKRIVEPKELLGRNAPSRARQIVLEGDVIVSTTRPNLNSVAHVSSSLNNQICSTGFCVLRTLDDLDSNYLFYFTQTPDFVSNLTYLVQGAMYPAVSDKQVREQFIPIPSLPEQKRITAILDERMAAIDVARQSAEAQLEAAEALAAAYLRDVFESEEAQGWPQTTNREDVHGVTDSNLPYGWRLITFGDIAKITAKIVSPTLPEYCDLPHVSGVNIESGTGRLLNIRSAAEDGMTSGKYLFDPGDVLYSKLRPYLQKAAYVDFQGLCSADMYPIKVDPDVLDARFTMWILLSKDFTSYADGESRRARMPKLNRKSLFAYKAPIPPLSQQRKIVNTLQQQFEAIDNAQSILQEQLELINKLPAALLRQAFNGEL